MPSEENAYQSRLIKTIEHMIPDCIVTKMDSGHIQGIPDLLVLYKDRWAVLEVKRGARESRQPNQQYYIDLFSDWSFASFIFPENEDLVLESMFSYLVD